MFDPNAVLTLSLAGLAGVGITAATTLKGWQGWLKLKQMELEKAMERGQGGYPPSPAQRIDLADLKERIRKLEAIAAGIDV